MPFFINNMHSLHSFVWRRLKKGNFLKCPSGLGENDEKREKMSLRWSTGNNFSWFLGPFLLIAHSDHLIFGINSNGHDEVVDEGWKVEKNADVYESNTQISISALVSLAQIHFCYLNLIFSSVLSPHRWTFWNGTRRPKTLN